MIGNPLEESHAQLQQATQFLQQRRYEQARAICETLLRRYPNYVGALHTLGLIFSAQNQNEHALDCVVRALMLSPRNKPVATALAEIYLRLGANEMAAQVLERTRPIKPQDADALLMLGDIYQEDCEYELARETYLEALAVNPDLVPAAIGLGWCYSHLGDYGEAARVFEGLIQRGVRIIEPVRALTTLPRQVVNIDLLAQLDRVVKEPGEDAAEFENSVEFFRAIALDRAGRYAEAWDHFTRANRQVFGTMRDRLDQIGERWHRSLSILRAKPVKTDVSDIPGQPISLFILGPSRCGKTTMEQLVATLDGVKRGHEGPAVKNAVLRTFQASSLLGTDSLELLPPHLYRLCREHYFEELARRAPSARVVTNTNPAYIHVAAFMVEIIKNVRFLFVKRNVEDNVLRIYMARYRSGNAYAYDLRAARDQVLRYNEMIDLMAEKFSDIVRVIAYEDMVLRPDVARSLAAELCGLDSSGDPLPTISDDSGCARPYRHFMEIEAGATQQPAGIGRKISLP